LGEFYREHGMDVNDELLVSQLAEGRFGVTPVVRADAQADSAADEATASDAGSTADSSVDGAAGIGTDSDTASGSAADAAVTSDSVAVAESALSDRTAQEAAREHRGEAEAQKPQAQDHERNRLD